MAYLRDLITCSGYGGERCDKPARVELLGVSNDRHGKYCKSHGMQALRALQKQEDENARKEEG